MLGTYADFFSTMSSVAAISGATSQEISALTAKAKEMGAATKFSASEAGAAMTYMGMAGWKSSDMLSGIEGIMNLAAASSNANTNVSLMGETFKYVGTQAGASLNAIMTCLATNTSGAADTVRALGVEFFNSDGTARKLSDVMDELRKATAEQNAVDSRSVEYDLVKLLLTAAILCQRRTKII